MTEESNYTEIFKQYCEENKPPTLWEELRGLGYFPDSCDEIVDAVEKWFPKEHDTNSYKWNECLKLMREKLR